MRLTSPDLRFVVCVDDGGYTDLVLHKVYRVKRDLKSLAAGLVRVVDDSGEDYLFPAKFFKAIQGPRNLLRRASSISPAGMKIRRRRKA